MKQRGMRRAHYPGEQAGNINLSRGLSVSKCPFLVPGDPEGTVEC